MPRILLTSILVLLCLAVTAQPKQYSFMHHGTSEGLSSHEVYSIVQDSEGYMWIGTNNGLQRFDGIRYRSFRANKNDPQGIPHNHVLQLLYDKYKNLWMLTNDGKVGRFDTRTFRYIESKVTLVKESTLRAEHTLLQDEEGNIFISYVHHDFVTWNPTTNEFSAENNFIRLPPGWLVSHVTQQPGTMKYWIGAANGLAVYDRETDQLSYAGHNIAADPVIEKFGKIPGPTRMMFDSFGRIWFDAWLGIPAIFCYDIPNNEVLLNEHRLTGKGYHETRGFIQQRDGTIWMKGLDVFARYLEKEKRFEPVLNEYRNEQSIHYDRVNDLYEDAEQNVWVATNNNGVYRFNPASQFFTNVRHVSRHTKLPGNGSVMSFMPVKNGRLLVGTWSDGLYAFDSNFRQLPLDIRGIDTSHLPFVWSMYRSKEKNIIWMGCQPGIIKYNEASRFVEYFNPAILQNRTIRQVAEDRLGNLWIGTQSLGVFKWDAKKGRKRFEDGVSQVKEIPINGIAKINIDNEGLVWIATFAHGVYVLDPSTEKTIMHFGAYEPEERKLLTDNPVSLLQYDDTTMIIAASGLHIFHTRQKKITRTIRMPESIPNFISAMERDKSGYLWLSTSSGIFRVNLQNRIFIHFDRIDGIGNDRFVLAASHVLPDGKIIFGADNQFVVFNPAEVSINQVSPDITITGFQLMNTPLLVDSLLKKNRITLAPDDNSIVIEFSGLRYNGTYLIRYKLEGMDKDWIIAEKTNQAVYSYLPPGHYTFMVQSQDAEGNTGLNTTTLDIVINPPFWRTWWFFCLLALTMAAIFYWFDRERMNKLKALQKVRTEIAVNLHGEVNSTLSNINLLSEMARIKADKDIERSKEFIDQISRKSHYMITAMDDILWSIDPANDNMQKSLLRMMEFTDSLKNRHGNNIELAIDKKVRSLKLDMKTRHEAFLIFKAALIMMVQYAGGKDTLVHIDLFRNKLSIKLQDPAANLELNAESIDELVREMHERASSVNADLDVQYDKNGVAVILLIPIS